MSGSTDLERALDHISANRSPKSELRLLSDDERNMVRFAQAVRGSRPSAPSEEFRSGLHARVQSNGRVSRRKAFVSGIATLAAGLVALFGLDRTLSGTNRRATPRAGGSGRWVAVAQVVDVPHGAIRTFRVDEMQGFLINKNGEYSAVSRICTHMGCRLKFEKKDKAFACPCHGAEFNLNGTLRQGPGGYGGMYTIPPLPHYAVRVRAGAVQVRVV